MIHVISGGLYTTVQDWPGRVGYWNVGIPPSGPMDPLAFRLGNKLVGNGGDEAGLEITFVGPTLRFERQTVIALTGAALEADLSGRPIPWWTPVVAPEGSTLTMGGAAGNGCRAYLAIQGGIDVPVYLGSRATFPTGKLGGLEGRPLADGDRLPLPEDAPADIGKTRPLGVNEIPTYGELWDIGAIPGPYAAPDYFTEADQEMFFQTEWNVYYNSSRLGYRLEGPEPQFARQHGGEGGTHPSNVHDYPYAIGTVNFTGVMPIIIAADGPSLGGFICMATIPASELWKVGQAKGNDNVRFHRTTVAQAVKNSRKQDKLFR